VISRVPPVVWLALTYAAGAVAAQAAPRAIQLPAFLLPALLLPIHAWRRPRLPLAILCAVLAGGAAGSFVRRAAATDCLRAVRDSQSVTIRGYFTARPGPGRRSAPFALTGLEVSCTSVVRVVLPRGGPSVEPGRSVDASGRWGLTDEGRGAARIFLFADRITPTDRSVGLSGRVARLRDAVEGRLQRLYPRTWGVVHALILARKDGLDPDVREAFAVAGLAHLLAISGFHVGVVAGMLFGVLRATGASGRGAAVMASVGVWAYVACIGAPDAAARAAALVSFAAWARVRGYPPHRGGALATALLAMMVADPGALGRVGLQLSFAGAAGLAVAAGPLERALGRGSGRRVPHAARSAVSAGVAATVFTLPLIVWHFERLSLVGIPATLVAGPLVALAIPGIFATLVLDTVVPPAASFLAGGVEWTLESMLWLVHRTAALPFAAAWVPRTWVPVGGVAAACTLVGLKEWGPLMTGRSRLVVSVSGLAGALIVWPALAGMAARGTVEIVVLDVGQGDAIAIRSPRGRWALIDAGPATDGFDAGERVVLPYLRRRGAGRLEALILTHPDLDHIGGAEAVLDGLDVRTVFDPGIPSPGSAYLDVLESVDREDAPWLPLRAGRTVELDGVELRVLSPPGDGDHEPGAWSRNDGSVVLLLRFGDFTALLTGDAEAEAEARLVRTGGTGPVDVLKVGHHGSSTSTTPTFLERVAPQAAVISVGRGNRYGHPAPEVMARLEAMGVRIYRTDRDGTLTVRARREGTFQVHTRR
jgi:competence protein ComEC